MNLIVFFLNVNKTLANTSTRAVIAESF